jgi:hypothetical protein
VHDHRAVVAVGRCALGEAREGGGAGEHAAGHRELVFQARGGQLRRTAQSSDPRAHGGQVDGRLVGPCDQAEHRRVEAVAGQHRDAVGVRGEKRCDDAAQRAEVHLMQREPLAEDAAGRQARAHGRELLLRVQRAGTAARRVEQVGHDHVVARAGGLHEAPRIGRHGVHGPQRHRRGRRPGEQLGRGDHLGQQFHRMHLQARLLRRGRGREAGAQAEEERLPGRRRVQQQRQLRQPPLDQAAGAAAFLRAVVDAQARHALGVGHHADRGHHAVAVAQHLAARGHVDEAQVRAPQRRGAGGHREQRVARAPPARGRLQQQVADHHQGQADRRADRRNEPHTHQRGRDGSARGVERQRAPERSPARLRLDAQVREQRAHHQRRRPHGGRGCKGFARQRAGRAGTHPARGPGTQGVGPAQRETRQQHRGRESEQQLVAQPRRIARAMGQALMDSGARGRAEQVHREQQRVAVDGAFGDLAEHAHGEHLVADAEHAGGHQQRRHAMACSRKRSCLRRLACSGGHHPRVAPQPPRQRRAQRVRRGAQQRGAQQPDVRNGDEHGQQQAEHRAEGVGRIEPAEAAARGAQLALERGQGGAHRRAGGQQQDERKKKGDRPVPRHRRLGPDQQRARVDQRGHGHGEREAPCQQQHLAAGVPAPGPGAACQRRAQQVRAEREAAEEGGQHGEHGHDLVAHRGAESGGPHHLPRQRRGAGQHHQQVGKATVVAREACACRRWSGGHFREAMRHGAPGLF